MKNRFSKILGSFYIFSLVLICVLTFTVTLSSQVPAQTDIDDVINGLENDFDLGTGKNEVKRQNIEATNEQQREDIKIVQDVLSSEIAALAGTYTFLILTYEYQFSGTGNFSATYTNSSGTLTYTLNGTIFPPETPGSNIRKTSFTVTSTEKTGPPTNFPANCTQSTTTTGTFTGDGSPGTKHVFTRAPLCSELGPPLLRTHTKQ